MWWNSVDISRVPLVPRPKYASRTPQWHSTTKRAPIDKAGPPVTPLTLAGRPNLHGPLHQAQKDALPGFVAKGQNKRPVPTHSRGASKEVTSMPSSNRPSPYLSDNSGKLRRPKSAPSNLAGQGGWAGSRTRPASSGKHREAAAPPPVTLKRPQSAPSMLRGHDGQRNMRMAHEDEFLQMVETSEIKSNMEVFKRERNICKDKVAGVDALADPSFYDLRIMHNRVQRAKSPGRRPQSAGSTAPKTPKAERGKDEAAPKTKVALDPTATDRVRDLCKELINELVRNGALLKDVKIETQALEELKEYMQCPLEAEKLKQKRERQALLESFGGFFKSKVAVETQPEELEDEELHKEKGWGDLIDPGMDSPIFQPRMSMSPTTPLTPMRGSLLKSGLVSPAQKAATQRLQELVGFLIGCCGSVTLAFRTFDLNNDRNLSLDEWEDGMRKLGYNDDVTYVFKLLGKSKVDKGATLDELQELFDPFSKGH